MFGKILRLALFCFCLSAYAQNEGPAIHSLQNGQLGWTNPITGTVSYIQRSTNLASGSWSTIFYEWATNGTILTPLPASSAGRSFYRILVQTNAPDPSLIMHLSFDNNFPAGTVLDVSGHHNHGRRYGRPGYPTNWPSMTLGPDGSQAAEFHWYQDGYGLYGKSGDYIGIPYSPSFTNLTQATICVWVHYYRSLNGDINNDHNSSILDTGKDVAGAFNFGRIYSDQTLFTVWTGPASTTDGLAFPDHSPDGESGGWHFYSATFDRGTLRGYFDGVPFQQSQIPVSALTMAGYYIAIAGWTFNATPEMDLSVDGHPNNAWINGAVDDLRIYNRALSPAEMQSLYRSFDTLPPTTPSNLLATPNSSSQVALHWNKATDLFGIDGYVLRRNDVTIATLTNTVYFDGELAAESTNIYTVQAFDAAGNYSPVSSAVVAVTPAVGTGVNVIVDDSDNAPWVVQNGTWPTFATLPGFYGSGFLSDENSDKGKTVTFRPRLPEDGDYNVFARFPGRSDISYLFSDSVPVQIVHGGQTNNVTLDQTSGFGTWKPLGRFSFSAGTNGFVRVGTAGTSGDYVFADAFMFVK